jgi:hypothetical protein
MEQHHIINGKPTIHGDIVHYTDHSGISHAALIKHIEPEGDGHVADLHVFLSTAASMSHVGAVPPKGAPAPHTASTAASTKDVAAVPHSATPAPHTWMHKPEQGPSR